VDTTAGAHSGAAIINAAIVAAFGSVFAPLLQM
jgi:hypothetical protein